MHTVPQPARQAVPARMVAGGGSVQAQRFTERLVTVDHLGELDIPTFIRRQAE
jgi:hypothetical protein